MPDIPTYKREKAALAEGYRLVAGIDEAGRGPLAGPVVAAAVILPESWLKRRPRLANRGLDARSLVRDSKQLSASQRERAYEAIVCGALAWGVGSASAQTIDTLGIVPATRMAMRQAIAALGAPPHMLLVDAVDLSDTGIPCQAIIHGDALCGVIAAASIIAKVTRDRHMQEIDGQFPEYCFAQHKGYATEEHLGLLARFGPSPIHRRSFAPIRQMVTPRLF